MHRTRFGVVAVRGEVWLGITVGDFDEPVARIDVRDFAPVGPARQFTSAGDVMVMVHDASLARWSRSASMPATVSK